MIYHRESAAEVHLGDAREVLASLPPASVDMILSDPPYLVSTLWSYDVLAEHAPRVLKPGAFLYAYVGAEFLPYAVAALSRTLSWFWLHNIRHARLPRMWSKSLMVSSKPVLAFTNGLPAAPLRWVHTDHQAGDDDTKGFHEWGQGETFARYVIMRRTLPGDVVLDPYCGGGTVLRAAKDCGRFAIGIEIDEESCRATVERLSQAVMPMFNENEYEQAVLGEIP